jgi:hypothetical protein
MAQIPAAPEHVLDGTGRPQFGTFRGAIAAVDWQGLAGGLGRWGRFRREKRWQYALVSTAEVALGVAIVDVGYVTNAFCYAVDLAARRLLFGRSAVGLPGQAKLNRGPDAIASGSFASRRLEIIFERGGDAKLIVRVRAGAAASADLELDLAGSVPLAAVLRLSGDGIANCTHKRTGLGARGSLEVSQRRWTLDGWAGLDSTHGLLARDTEWRWAFASGRAQDGQAVGWNLTEGFAAREAASTENAVWIGGEPHVVGAAWFDRPAEGAGPWHVHTDDGAVDLTFAPAAGHRENHNLLLASSRFLQLAGLYQGTLRLAGRSWTVAQVVGVAEDQHVRW